MTARTVLLGGALLLLPASAWTQTGPAGMNEPTVHAGIFMVRPDGGFGGSATQAGKRVGAITGGIVYLAPCSYGAQMSGPGAASATDVWQLSGRILALTAEEAAVQIGWQRLRRGGQEEVSTPQTLTVTLRRGERTTLESVTLPPGSCAEGHASLDVAFIDKRELYTADGADTVPKAAVAPKKQPASTALTAELWLVRSTPGRADEMLHLTSPVVSAPQTFAFGPMRVQTANGPLTVKVEGNLQVGRASDSELRFHFSANRAVTYAPTNRPARDTAPLIEGSTKTTVPMPKPDEVLSFEMPPLRIPGGETLPDRLSIRVRLRSVPMRK